MMRELHDWSDRVMDWLLDERIILLAGAIGFSLLGLLLVSWNAKESYVLAMFGLSAQMIGALIRGITGPIGKQTQPQFTDQNGSERITT
jgi:uncharacterized membrane protein